MSTNPENQWRESTKVQLPEMSSSGSKGSSDEVYYLLYHKRTVEIPQQVTNVGLYCSSLFNGCNIKCNYCQRSFSDPGVFMKHVSRHLSCKFQCKKCGKALTTKQGLKKHLQTHANMGKQRRLKYKKYQPKQVQDKGSVFPTSSTSGSVQGDDSNEMPELGPPLVSVPPQATAGHDNKSRDKKRQHGCSVCGRQLSSKQALQMHMERHTGIRSFVCSVCGKGFSSRTYFDRHMTDKHQYKENISYEESLSLWDTDGCTSQLNGRDKRKSEIEENSCEPCSEVQVVIDSDEEDLLPGKPIVYSDGHERKAKKNAFTNIERQSEEPKYNKYYEKLEKPYLCLVCFKEFSYEFYYNRHMKLHADVESQKDLSGSNDSLVEIERPSLGTTVTDESEDDSSEKLHLCKYCSKQFLYDHYLARHVELCHTQPLQKEEHFKPAEREEGHSESLDLIGEEDSGIDFVNHGNHLSKSVDDHALLENTSFLKVPPLDADKEDGGERQDCITTTPYVAPSDVLKTLNNETVENVDAKDSCTAPLFRSEEQSKAGMNEVFKCEACDKQVRSKEALILHLQQHVMFKSFSCDICEKKFSSKSYLKQHSALHRGVKGIECETCGRKFVSKYYMKVHYAICNEEKAKKWRKRRKKQQIAQKQYEGPKQLQQQQPVVQENHYQEQQPHKEVGRKTNIVEEKEENDSGAEAENLQEVGLHRNIPIASNARDMQDTQQLKHEEFLKKLDEAANLILAVNGENNSSMRYQIKPDSRSMVQESNRDSTVVVEDSESCNNFTNSATQNQNNMIVYNSDTLCTPEKEFSRVVYKCATCGQLFSSNAELMIHSKCHTNSKAFTCPLCNKEFASHWKLGGHMNAHRKRKRKRKDKRMKLFEPPAIDKGLNKDLIGKNEPYISKSHGSAGNLVPRSSVTCSVCGNNFSNKASLEIHHRTHTGERPYQCERCGKSFSVQAYLKIHNRIHTGERPYQCENCGKTFSFSSNRIRHWKMCRKKPLSATHRRKMNKTKDNGLKSGSLRRNQHSDLVLVSETKSSRCISKRSTQAKIGKNESYISKSHGSAGNLVPRASVTCPVCGKSFSSRYYLKIHNRIHTGERPYQCENCDRTFSFHSSLRNHGKICKKKPLSATHRRKMNKTKDNGLKSGSSIRNKHSDLVLVSETKSSRCISKRSTHAEIFDMMPQSKTGVEPYPCNVCGEVFSSKTYLETHVKTHTGEKPFSCRGCSKKFTHSASCLQHQRLCHKIHPIKISNPLRKKKVTVETKVRALPQTEQSSFTADSQISAKRKRGRPRNLFETVVIDRVKAYKCRSCSKVMNSMSAFKLHARVHTDERPFSCQVCARAFKQSTNLNRHLQTIHNLQMVKKGGINREVCADKSLETSTLMHVAPRLETTPRENYCEICGKHFFNLSNLNRHKYCVHQADPYQHQCYICGNHFKLSYELKAHLLTHYSKSSSGETNIAKKGKVRQGSTKKGNYPCDTCSKVFTLQASLKKHKLCCYAPDAVSRHHICNTCGLKFKHVSVLKLHLETHADQGTQIMTRTESLGGSEGSSSSKFSTEVGPPSPLGVSNCSKCDASFSCKDDLINHLVTHITF